MWRNAAWLVMVTGIAAAGALVALKGGQSHASLLPLLRTGQEHGRQMERLAGHVLLPIDADEERRLGLELRSHLPAAGQRTPEVRALGRRLERTGLVPRYAGRYQYATIPGGAANAYSAPGGFIMVGEPLIDHLEGNTDRLAFVIAHELAHVELGHTADLVRYKGWLERLHVPGSDFFQALRTIPALAYSESQELEADALAVKMLRTADLRPGAALEALELTIPAEREKNGAERLMDEALLDYFKTHPGRQERLDRLRAL